MGNEWKTGRLGDFADVQTGPFGSQLHQRDYVEVGTPIITVEHLGDNRIIHSNLPRVSDQDKLRLKKYWMQPGDIIFSRVGSVDRRAFVHDKESGWLFSGRCLRVRVNSEHLDSRFLSYFFGSETVKEHIRQIAVGATMPSLNTSLLSNLDIIVPPLSEQRAIAHILGSLDDKIELNRRMNETLEQMARAIFKSWFVDFDPVRDKSEGRDPGLPEEIAELFPDGFEQTEMGEVPRGWRVGTLADVSYVKGGFAYKSKDFTDNGFPVIKIKNINSDKTVDVDDVQYIPNDIADKTKEFWLDTGDLVVAMTGATVGKFGLIVIREGKPCLLNQRVAKFIPHKSLENKIWFTYCYLCQQYVLEHIINVAHGSAQPNISATSIMNTPIIVPPYDLINEFNRVVDFKFERILVNQSLNHTLISIRDSLLPKLISGELRIPDAEEILGEMYYDREIY